MTDQGYSVFWNETDSITGRRMVKHRHHFTVKCCADAFAASLPPEHQARVYEMKHTSDEQRDSVGRDNTDALNRQRLVQLMLEHNITIPAKQWDKWRPTVEKTGRIEGIADGLTCVMTDGLLGYFIREGRAPLYGHVQHFMWDIPEVSYVPYWTPEGQKKFFKQVREQGAPPAYHKRPPRLVSSNGSAGEAGKPKAKLPRAPISTLDALALIKRMTREMKA